MSTHDIIDNRTEKLTDHIKLLLHNSKRADFAVGYLFTSGLQPIYKDLEKLERIRLIIGNTTNKRTIEQLAEAHGDASLAKTAAEKQQFVNPSKKKEIIHESSGVIRENLSLIDQTDGNQSLLETLRKLLSLNEPKMKVRIYTKGRLHSKAYIFDYREGLPDKGSAIIGSSNLSISGLSDNTELNVRIYGQANLEQLHNWFDSVWDTSEDFNKELLHAIEESWALNQVRPYDIYIKTLYSLLKDRLESEEASQLLWEYALPPLTDFQKIAVKQALQILNEYDGVIVGDVVGLGKTYIGIAMLKYLHDFNKYRPLVIAPASVTEYWDELLSKHDVPCEVVSMGMLSQEGFDLSQKAKYRDADVILIDESHNFRYPQTQRYRVLQPFLFNKKVILVTATPRNNTPWDIYHQIKLFHHQDNTLIPIDPANLRQFFKQVEEGKTQIQELLRRLLIRRTRKHILEHYGIDDGKGRKYVLLAGKPVYFPDRILNTETYSIDSTYAGLYDKIMKQIGQLTLAKYGLWRYVKPELRDKSPYRELQQAGPALRGLMRMLLLKRFESSVKAFKESVDNLLRIHTTFINSLNKGIVPAGEEAQRLIYKAGDEDEEALLKELEAVSGTYDAKDFYLTRMRQDIESDIEIFNTIRDDVKSITPRQDDKLQTLLKILRRDEVKEKKILIFTQFADTANYIHENLPKDIASAEVESETKNRLKLIQRFAPKSNNYTLRNGEQDIQLLVSTDVLSEGLNLQDGSVVINYDIHWNPVRLIQRIGRVDRMGALSDIIQVFNFLPETALDKHLKLSEKIRNRISEIHRTIGEDAKILDKTEQLNEQTMYAIYDERNQATLDMFTEEYDPFSKDLFGLGEAEELLRQIKKDDPKYFEYIQNLPDGVRSARHSSQPLTYAFFQKGDYQQLYLAQDEGKIISKELGQILSLIKCPIEENPLTIPKDHNKTLNKLKEEFVKAAEQREGQKQARDTLKIQQRYVVNHLQKLYESIEDPQKKREIEQAKEAIAGTLPPIVQSMLASFRREGLAGDQLLEKIRQIYSNYQLWRYRKEDEEERIQEPTKIICSTSLLS